MRGRSGDAGKIEWVVDLPHLRLGCGDSVHYGGPAGLIFSHLYGPIPPHLRGAPTIVNLYGNKQEAAEAWIGAPLHEIGRWGRGLTNRVYVAHLPVRQVAIDDLVEEEFAPGRGWMPLELPRRLLLALDPPGDVVFDGFMGRGTIGAACREQERPFVGIDINPERVALAKDFLGC